jgi:peptidyl-tRNA hydrolase, PTH1 family
LKIVAGLGNPGPEYDGTRHNVGWWALDRIALDWDFGPYKREGATLVTSGSREGLDVLLLKPTAYMNRSGPALRPWLGKEGLDPSRDLLVIVDDAALDVGRVRFRPGGSDGGHNGLRSVARRWGAGSSRGSGSGWGGPHQGRIWSAGSCRRRKGRTRTGSWICSRP